MFVSAKESVNDKDRAESHISFDGCKIRHDVSNANFRPQDR